MNTVLLHYVVEVEKTGSITRAAENLGMDQPNLSRSIKMLEESLGAPVFKRTSKGMVPTDKGKIFLEHSRNVLAQIEEMEMLYKTPKSEGVEFGISVPRASYIGLAFSRFAASLTDSPVLGDQSAMNIWFRETNSSDTIQDVESGEYRLGIIRSQALGDSYTSRILEEAGLDSEVLWEYTCLVLMSKSHPLAAKEHVTAEDLDCYIEIIHGDTSLTGDMRQRTEQNSSCRRIYVFERGSQFDLLRENKNTYMWVSPVPGELLHMHGLIQKECLAADKRYRDILIYRRGSRPGKTEKRFLRELKQMKEELSAL